MNVKLNIDYTVCRDGIHEERFKAGQEVEMPQHIAEAVLRDGRAAKVEGKAKAGAPENKALPGPPENKGRFFGRKKPRS